MTAAELAAGPTTVPWSPTSVDKAEFVILSNLANGKIERIDNPKLIGWLESQGTTVDAVTNSLHSKGLIYVKDGEFRLLVEHFGVHFSKGGCYVGDDRTGRFSRWTAKNLLTKSSSD